MVEKVAFSTSNTRSMTMKSNKKGRGSMSRGHTKNTGGKVQNNFGIGGSNSLNWRNEGSAGKNSVSESNNYGYNNHYVANAFYLLIGLQVEIQKKDGNIHEGILETVSNKLEFLLSHVCEKSNINGMPKSEKMEKKVIFPFSDVVYCRVPSVDLDFAKRDTLLTDGAISGTTNGNYGERELVQWQPEDNGETTINTALGESNSGGVSGWAFDEMMRVNEEEHGVKSTFDSSMSSYMTPLEKGDEEEFRARERRAEQVAREIQKDPKFKDVDNIDSGLGEEEMFSSVSRLPNNNYNSNNNTPINNNSNNNTISNSNNSPNNNDGFTTYTGKNYRGRHTTTPASVVGPRLQRNNLRNHEGQNNHTSPGNHQANRNHISSPQRSQTGGNPPRNASYQQQMNTQQKQQQLPYQRIDHHKVSVPSHGMQENIPPGMGNNRVPQCDPAAAANTARSGLSYSAVAMKKDAVVNNRGPPKQVIPVQPVVLQDVIQPVVVQDEMMIPPLPPHDQLPPLLNPAGVEASSVPSPVLPVEQFPPVEKSSQPAWTPEALAAAKQQMIQDARKKASMGHAGAQAEPQPTTTLLPAVCTTTMTTAQSTSEVTSTVLAPSTITSPLRQQPQGLLPKSTSFQPSAVPVPRSNVEVGEKPRAPPAKVDSSEKVVPNVEIKSEVVAGVSPKEQRSRGGGEDNKQPLQPLMKYGRIQNVPEEKKGSSYKELKDFGEQFKLEAKPKKRSQKSAEPTGKPSEGAVKKADASGEVKSEEQETTKNVFDAKGESRMGMNTDVESYTTPNTSAHLVITTVVTSSSVTVVSSLNSAATTQVTSTTTTVPSSLFPEPPSPSSQMSSLNPSAKEFNFNPSAKEFDPGRDNPSPFAQSPKQSPARQNSSSTPMQHNPVHHQPYYHTGQTVMIHSNGPEVISPTVQSVPMKQIYARPYMSPGPGGSTVYSIPAVQFNNNNTNGPQIIAAPQSGFISQNPSGQQMMIIHGPNESYQQIVQVGQAGQQYYPMQQMIRCMPGPPTGNSVQQAAAARVPANFQQDGSPGGYVLTASQHGGLVQHPSVPGNQHPNYHPPQSPVQSSHLQTQYAITHAPPSTYIQNPQSPAQLTYTQGNNGPAAFRSPSSIHSVTGQHHPQQPFVMVTHQGQHVQTVAVPNNQSYVQGQQYGAGILQNYQSGN